MNGAMGWFKHFITMTEQNQKTLADIRQDYLQDALLKKDLDSDPLSQFKAWLSEAIELGIKEPTAMNLATVGEDGRPSSRTVLLKGADEEGFRFFTCYGGRKALEIKGNPEVALHFFWANFPRQIAVRGKASKLSRKESADYFSSRPRQSQLGAWASCQSSEVANRDELEQDFLACERKFEGSEIPIPPDWGGYLVVPEFYEFWQGRPGRLHDRFVYEPDGFGGWTVTRLAP